MGWFKKFREVLIKPENVAEKIVFAIFILVVGLLLSYTFERFISPHPKIVIRCETSENEKMITLINDGRISAEEVDLRVYATEPCNFAMGLAEVWNVETDFLNFSWYSYPGDIYSVNSILKRNSWSTGSDFMFICPLNTRFKAVIGGKNLPSVEKKC